MHFLLAIASAAAYGVSDFTGGLASRRYATLDVLFLAYPVSALVALMAAPFFGGSLTVAASLLGLGSGLALALAVWCFYTALARGPMGIVSSITAVMAAGLPVVYGMSIGEQVSNGGLLGIALAMVAIYLISRGTPGAAEPVRGALHTLHVRVLLLTGAAGTAFALSFVLTHAIPTGAGLWPVVLARVSGWVLILLVRRVRFQKLLHAGGPLVGYALLIGCLDALANSAMYFALQGSQLAPITVVISLYPAFTILLALGVLKERFNAVQGLGTALAILSVAIISYATA